MKKLKINQSLYYFLIVFFLFYLTVLLGFYFDEDSLGGAKSDFIYHYNLSLKFGENLLSSLKSYGDANANMNARNSPVFWILISFLNKFLSMDFLRLLNSSISILISILFYKCLKIKFKNINRKWLILLACVLYLSPSLRSISIWPYTLGWGLFFLLLSTINFLKFESSKIEYKKNIFSYLTIFFIALSAYIHPSLAVFFIFYILKFYNFYRLGIKFIYILIFSVILASPSIYFIFSNDFVGSFQAAQGANVSNLQSINISNKFLIVYSMIIFFLIPILNFSIVIKKVKNLKFNELFFIFIFCLLNIYFFNYPPYDSGLGGGLFYKLSNILFENNLLFYLSAITSIIIIYAIIEKNFYNYLLLFLFIIYTPQLTIYNKYYDPLVLIIFTIFITFSFEKHFFKKKYKFLQLYLFAVFYLLMGLFKDQIY